MNLGCTRQRSPVNFLVNLIAALTAYLLTKGKPKNYLFPYFFSIVAVKIKTKKDLC